MKIIYNNENFKKLGDLITLDFLCHNSIYIRFEGYDYYINYFNGSETLLVRNITNAGKIGRECWEYRLNIEKDDNFLFELLFSDFDDVFTDIALHRQSNRIILRAVDVFNPFTIKKNYKPLKEEPKKWTLRHALRAIVNHQYENFRCDGQYTDDYAHDDEVNYMIGEIKDITNFLRNIIENKSGWKVYPDHLNKKRINIDCYHFDTNSFIFKGVA